MLSDLVAQWSGFQKENLIISNFCERRKVPTAEHRFYVNNMSNTLKLRRSRYYVGIGQTCMFNTQKQAKIRKYKNKFTYCGTISPPPFLVLLVFSRILLPPLGCQGAFRRTRRLLRPI